MERKKRIETYMVISIKGKESFLEDLGNKAQQVKNLSLKGSNNSSDGKESFPVTVKNLSLAYDFKTGGQDWNRIGRVDRRGKVSCGLWPPKEKKCLTNVLTVAKLVIVVVT